MGSSARHLRELLSEDQEPFVLKSYIDEKKTQIKRSSSVPKSTLQVKRRKPISETSSFPKNLCKNACFFSSPKSPLFDFCSPAKSPLRNQNTLFVQIPAKTAALLLEAALRIQNHSANQKRKGFGVFGSILKRMAPRKRGLKKGEDVRVSVKKWESSKKPQESILGVEEKEICEMGFSCSSNSRRTSVWSESNEEKSFDLETSSSRSEDEVEMELLVPKIADFGEKDFCSSPFRFVLLSPAREFNTPIQSPSRLKQQQAVYNEQDGMIGAGKEHEDEKDQNSPVSVLDPPFEDDDDDEGHGDEMEEENGGFEIDHSFAFVQRAKQQLLHKLSRFERLAGLDAVELEKRIAEEEDEDRYVEEQYSNDDDVSILSDNKESDHEFIEQVLEHSDLYHHNKTVSSDMKRLIMDLMAEEEEKEIGPLDREMVAKKVSKRLESWKEVDTNTIDMMVELDFKSDNDQWRKNPEQMRETAVAIEMAVFGFLVEEFSDELAHSSDL